MKVAFIALIAVATVASWSLARRRSDHRPIAWLMIIALGGEIAQWAIDVAVIAPLRAELGTSAPWTGWARVAGHVVDAVWLAWPAAIVGASFAVFAKRSARPVWVGWVLAVATLVAAHPIAGDGSQGRMLTVMQALATAASVGLAVAWYRRRKEPVTPGQAVLAVLIANEALFPLAAWWIGAFDSWNIMQVGALMVWGIVAALQWRVPWATKLSPSAP